MGVRQSECAVCYCPTTTRCSRCKAVRYCSGKCQIIHWRLGHKDECYPPKNSLQFNGPKSDTDQKVVSQGNQYELYEDSVELKHSHEAKSAEASEKIESFTTSSHSPIKDDGNVGDAPFISDSTSNEPLANTSFREVSVSGTPNKLEEHPVNSIAQKSPDTKVDFNCSKRTEPPPLECSTSDVSTGSSSNCESSSFSDSSSDVPREPKVAKPSISSSDFWEGALESNGLKTSVSKVVQQFKVYKLSKHYATGFGRETAEKYDYEMLFPYELFVKLYHSNKVELLPCGLINCGNSCYANAVLQCLSFTRPLTVYLLQGFHSKTCPKKEWCFMCEFQYLIMKAKEGKSPISPIGILSQLQNSGSPLGHGREEDAHEFLRYAIDAMQSVCLKEAREIAVGHLAEETSLIGLIFGGYLQSKIKCMKCHVKSERHERMMDLTVEIHGNIRTLEEALGQFTATEILDGENKYECLRCKSYEKAKKKLTILEAPNVLTIALKRFQSGNFEKLNKSVQFPEILDLAPYMSGTSDKSPIYRLYAVVVHLELNDAFSGHYVCYVRIIQGKWFMIDDSKVKPVELERVLSEKAYMLFYARCSPRAPSLIRNTVISNSGKFNSRSRCFESIPSIRSKSSREGPNCTVRNAGQYSAQRSAEEYPYWTTFHGPNRFESVDLFDGRFPSMQRIPKVDSSSDNSSLLSCSDEGSSSTESTRDSASTDDLPDYLFVEPGQYWNSPVRAFEDSPYLVSASRVSGFPETSGYSSHVVDRVFDTDGVCSSQSQDSGRRRDGWRDPENLPILQSDTMKKKNLNLVVAKENVKPDCQSPESEDIALSRASTSETVNHIQMRI
ncbi:Ubiquitin carboxyl-terminal hydrolase [Thalictrum thalictroides]|uniref:ubiquitinyl hydrolase 1 n=1 Tax=Thalictrum thalictroides TaxID=46969 RepID=A0A7J6WVF1_THATH|nr:Ubiquitin carboxyl-terminal hydrolase [Thalictrum thalictroides]